MVNIVLFIPVLVTFGDEVMKLRKYYGIFVYILQGKMGKTEKNRKENHVTKVTKIPKTQKMNETIKAISSTTVAENHGQKKRYPCSTGKETISCFPTVM